MNMPKCLCYLFVCFLDAKVRAFGLCGFIAQLVEQRTGNVEVTGSNPVEALIFSGFFFPIA